MMDYVDCQEGGCCGSVTVVTPEVQIMFTIAMDYSGCGTGGC